MTDDSPRHTSRFDALIALIASAAVFGASFYFVNPQWAAEVDGVRTWALALLP